MSKLNWCDTGIVYETEAGGSGEGEQQDSKQGADAGEMSVEALKAKLAQKEADLQRANAESAGRRKKLEAYEQAETEKANADKSELEKVQAKAEKLEADLKTAQGRAKTAAIRGAILLAASEFIDSADAIAQADLSKVEVDDDFNVTGAKEAVAALAKAKPYLLKQKDKSGGNPPGPKPMGGAGDADREKQAKQEQERFSQQYW